MGNGGLKLAYSRENFTVATPMTANGGTFFRNNAFLHTFTREYLIPSLISREPIVLLSAQACKSLRMQYILL